MREILPDIDTWTANGRQVALATVVEAWGSAPRPLGSAMAISSEGDIAGSVSGGCVEGAVAEEARTVISTGSPKLVGFGVSDETAWSVGLSCGGRIEVFIESITAGAGRDRRSTEPSNPRLSALFRHLRDRLRAEESTVRAVVVDGPASGGQLLLTDDGIVAGSSNIPELDRAILEHSGSLFERLSSDRRMIGVGHQTHDVFFEMHLPRPQLIIVGAVHVAIHLVSLARRLGYSTIVIDPRTAFATPERFAEADSLLSAWPQKALEEIPIHRTTCFVFLSHDLKIDLPGLEIALDSPALYIGALGSKKTHAKRVAALLELGCSAEGIDRISAPIGLDLGGRRAEEIALSIMAEIVAVRYGRT